MPIQRSRGEQLIRLNKIEAGIGIVGGIITLLTAYAVVSVIPYRVSQLENEVKATNLRISAVEKDREKDHELLIRIDERLNQMQLTLKESIKQTKP